MPNFLQRNLNYKIISLILAIVFWAWITTQNETAGLVGKQTINVPLVTYNQPPNLVMISNIPPITVQINNNNQGISVEDFYAYLDLKDAKEGENAYQVKMDAPEGVTINNISPSSVVVQLDKVEDKIVPVIVNVTGTPAEGFERGEPIITPAVVNVRGPASILEKLSNVVVEASVSGMQETVRTARPVTFQDLEGLGIFAPDPNLKTLNAFPGTVEVIIPIKERGLSSKTVPVRADVVGEVAKGMMVRGLEPVPGQVTILGEEAALKAIGSLNIGTVDVTGLSSAKAIDIPLAKVSLPKGVTFAEGTRISVLVNIGANPVERTMEKIPVEIRNVNQGLTVKAIEPLRVTVSGYPEILSAYRAGDISLWIDATGMKAGTHQNVTLLWKAPAGIAILMVPKVDLVLSDSNQPQPTGTVQNTSQ